jgi:hypothetical protein
VLRRGTRVGGWVLERPLGDGASASVWLAAPAHGGASKVVVKLLRADGAGLARDRFSREVALLERLDHPAVVRLLDHGVVGDPALYYLAMPWVEGEALAAVLDEGALEVEDALELFADLADGLAYAHARGVMHRDLKPHNVLVTSLGRGVLLDFGTAFDRGGERITEDGRVPGTLGWLAPEVFEPTGRPDPALGDVYALGVMLWEALEGRKAFEPPPGLSATALHAWMAAAKRDRGPLMLGPSFDEDLVAFVAEATHPDPRQRLPSMADFAQVLGCEGPWTPSEGPAATEVGFETDGDALAAAAEGAWEETGLDLEPEQTARPAGTTLPYAGIAAVAVACVALAGGVAVWWARVAPAPEASVAEPVAEPTPTAPAAAVVPTSGPRPVDLEIPDGLTVALDGVPTAPIDGHVRQTVASGPHKVELVDGDCAAGRCCGTFVLDIPAGMGPFLWRGTSVLPACPEAAPPAEVAVETPPMDAAPSPAVVTPSVTPAAVPRAPAPTPPPPPARPPVAKKRVEAEPAEQAPPPPVTLAFARAGVRGQNARTGSTFAASIPADRCVDRAERPQIVVGVSFEVAAKKVKRDSASIQPASGLSDGDRRCLVALIENLDVGRSDNGNYTGQITLAFE